MTPVFLRAFGSIDKNAYLCTIRDVCQSAYMTIKMQKWWNGRHDRLKIC